MSTASESTPLARTHWTGPTYYSRQEASIGRRAGLEDLFANKARLIACGLIATLNSSSAAAGSVYQFGVYTGHSLKFLTHTLREHGLRARAFGFDSFEGLPEEAAPPELAASGGDRAFRRGDYNAADALKTSSWPELRQRVLRYINHPVPGGVELIRGFFNESLTPTLAQEAGMQPALWVDLDVDQYVGTMQAFEWMLASGLIVRGTYVSFDDFNDEYDTEPPGGPVALAYQTLTAKYGIRWRQIYSHHRRKRFWYEVFQVLDVARPPPLLTRRSKYRQLAPAHQSCIV